MRQAPRNVVTHLIHQCRMVCWNMCELVVPAHCRHIARDCILKERCCDE
nr:MAG TPA: hypothetical protein [Siphoviridae sp. cta6m1]